MSAPILTRSQRDQFERDGYLVIRDFVSPATCTSLLDRARTLLDDFSLEGHPKTKFSTGDKSDHVGDDYFLDSGDKIRFFFEVSARLASSNVAA